MNRVLASFTSGERNIIAFVMMLVAGGYGLLEWQSTQQKTLTFSAATPAVAGELSVPEAMPIGMNSGGLVDLNVADGKVLETLPGIGPSLAGAITRHRNTHGAFGSMVDLDEVPGIGPSMMTKLAPMVTFGAGATTLPDPPIINEPALGIAPLALPAQATAGPININTADTTELDKLKGVGPALAQRIIQHRQKFGHFRSAEDILRVKGIGPKILQNNRNRLSIN